MRDTEPVFDFTDFIDAHVKDFTGREWLFDKVKSWLASQNASRYFIITGEPGIGKTAIASRLTRVLDLAAVHFCIARQTDTIDPLNFARSICFQLTCIDDFVISILEEQGVHIDVRIDIQKNYGQVIGVQIESLIIEAPSAAIAFNRAVLDPLRRMYAGGFNRQVVILVDALDEAVQQRGPENIVNLIVNAQGLNPQVRFVLTSRPEEEVLGHFEALEVPPLLLDARSKENTHDIREYVYYHLVASETLKASMAEQKIKPEVFAERIMNACKGNFLYLVWLLRAFKEGTQRFDALATLPQGLDGVYREFLRVRTIGTNFRQWQLYRPLLGVLAAAQIPLTPLQLTRFTGLSPQEVNDSLFSVQQFLDPLQAKQKRYQLYHQSLIDFLSDEKRAGKFLIELAAFHSQIDSHYLDSYAHNWAGCDIYGLSYLPAHLIEAKYWEGLEQTLCDLHFIEAKCAAGMTHDLVTDYNAALDALPEAQEEKQKELKHEARLKEYTKDLIAYARGEIKHLDIMPSVEPWSAEKIKEDTERIINNPTRLDRIKAFSQFLNSEGHALVKFTSNPGFCIQHAYNSASSGPVASAAEAIIDAGAGEVLLVRPPSQRSDYNPHPALLKTLERHTGSVTSVSLTLDGKIAISGSHDKTLRVWDLERGKCLKALEGHTYDVTSVSITPDGKRAISGSFDKTLRVWDLEGGNCLRMLTSLDSAVCIASDGKTALSGGSDNKLRMWDLESEDCIKTLEGHTRPVTSVSLTLDRKIAISGSFDKTLRVWDLERGKCLKTLEGHADSVEGVSVTPDGRRAVSGSHDKTVRVWDLERGKCLKTLEGHADSVEGVSVTPDGRRAVSGSLDNTVRVWDLERGDCVKTLKGHTNLVLSVEVAVEGRRAISGSADNNLRVWDIESGQCLETLKVHKWGISAWSVTADGGIAVSGSYDNNLGVWDFEGGECLRILEGHTRPVTSVSLTLDGKIAISGGQDRTVRVWDLESGECLGIFGGHNNMVVNVIVTPDGSSVISLDWDFTMRLWGLESGECIITFTSPVTCASVTPDGKLVISGSYDKSVRLWDIASGQCLKTLEGHADSVEGVSVTPDGRHAVSGSRDKTVRVWDLESGECLRTLKLHDHVWSVTPDGRRAVSGGDKAVRVWDLESGQCLHTLEGHTSVVKRVRVAPDGKWAVSASEQEGTLRVWDVESGECIAIYKANGGIISLSEVNTSGRFALSTNTGEVVLLTPHNLPMKPPIVTPIRLWIHDYDYSMNSGHWDDEIKAVCQWCGQRFLVSEKVLDVIRAINQNAGLTPDQSPCLELPDEAWEEPWLLSECPLCHKPLRFNPFVVDNRGRY